MSCIENETVNSIHMYTFYSHTKIVTVVLDIILIIYKIPIYTFDLFYIILFITMDKLNVGVSSAYKLL
jgi:hypothetical protein